MMVSEYTTLYGLRNATTGKLILYYWASSQKHKALFSTKAKAEEAAINVARDISGPVEIIIIE